jgi:polar amino acid transport system permease protein
MGYDFDWSVLTGEYGLGFIDGTVMTLRLVFWSLSFALILGLFFGTLRWIGGRVLEPICWLYVEFTRNTPPLVQILFWYFSVSFILPVPAILWLRDIGLEFAAVVFALSLYHGAFIAEVIRAGLNSIPRGQFEASRALGLGFFQRMRWVVAPQALRIIIPPLTNETVSLIKNTSLGLAVGVAEITYHAKYIDAYTFRAVEALCAATLIYLVLCLGMSGLGELASRHLSRNRAATHAMAPSLD